MQRGTKGWTRRWRVITGVRRRRRGGRHIAIAGSTRRALGPTGGDDVLRSEGSARRNDRKASAFQREEGDVARFRIVQVQFATSGDWGQGDIRRHAALRGGVRRTTAFGGRWGCQSGG